MPDDAMDLNDEGVEAAARVLYDRVKSVPTLTYDIAYPSEQDDFRRVASAMLTAYLRAVPESESDELVRLRARNDQMLAVLWSIKMACERASVDDPVFALPNLVIHYAEGAMGPDRERAQSLANSRLSPDEAAGE